MINKDFNFDNLEKKEMANINNLINFNDGQLINMTQYRKNAYAMQEAEPLTTYNVDAKKFKTKARKDVIGTIPCGKRYAKVDQDNVSRWLSPLECFKLMGFTKEDYNETQRREMKISNSQLYKQAGNSIVVQVAEAILKELHGDTKKEIKHFELFAGIGAFSKAYKNLGYNHKLVGYSEIDKYASKSFSLIHNVSEELNLGDITKFNRIDDDIDILTGGFPCQDISNAGKGKGIVEGETRSGLMFDMLRITKANKPKVVIAENVKNLLSKKHKPQFDLYIKTMEEMGYKSTYKVLNAKDYGIPQSRERVFIVSIKM